MGSLWIVVRPSESESKTTLVQCPLPSRCVEDVSSETAVLVEYWRHRGAILGPLGGILGPPGGLLGPSWTVMKPSESELKTTLIQSPLRSQCVEDVSSETALLVEYWRHLGAILGPLGGLLGPPGGLLEPFWTVMRPSESESKTILIRSPLQSQFVEDVSSEAAVLVKYWRHLGAILSPLGGSLGPS